MGAHANTCAPAAVQGTAPSDFQNYCWLDFSGYSDPQAQAGGQPYSFSLPDGSTLNLTLKVSTNRTNPALFVHAVPSWSGSAIGHSGFNDIPGKPVVYEVDSTSTVDLALSNIVVTPPPGSGANVAYSIVAADGESSNQNEALTFTTNAAPWQLVATIPQGPLLPGLSGVSTTTVVETGVRGRVGSYAFASFKNPTQISAVLKGGGLQGAMFAIRYAVLSVTVQLNGARANASDQFTYQINSVAGNHSFAGGVSSGAGAGPFGAASLITVTGNYPLVVTETMAPGSASSLGAYAASLTCTNRATGATATALPANQTATTYTFPSLHYGDAIACVFTNTANRANVTMTKTGPATVKAGATLTYSLVATNTGPASASGTRVLDPAVANFTAQNVTCVTVSGGGQCPPAGTLTIAGLQGPGIVLPTLPSGSSVTLAVTGIAGNGSGNITNTATVTVPATVINTATNPGSSATTTVTPDADAATTLSFPPNVDAGLPVRGTVQFSNLGIGAAEGDSFSITVPMNLAAAPVLSGLPTGAMYKYNPTTGVITLTGMPTTVAPGAALAPITLGYVQPPSGTSTITATFNTTSTDSNPANNTATAKVGGVPESNLSSKVTLNPHVNAGQTVAGTVLFTNAGPSTATGVTYTLTLPTGLAVPPTLTGLPAGATYSYAPGTGVVTVTGLPSTLATGASVGPIAFTYTQPASGTSTVTAVISSITLDPDLANNKSSATSTGAAAEVTGTVYLDNNQDATFDAGDAPIAGATVDLLSGGHVVATAVTGPLGTYTFSGEPAGVYSVSVAPQQGNVADTPTSLQVTLGAGKVPVANFGQIRAAAVGMLVLTKTTPRMNISAGESVPYTITAANPRATPVYDATVTDFLPAGFRYRVGSGSVNGKKLEPTVSGRQLSWTGLHFAPGETKIFTLVLTAGAGVVSGEFVNQAMAYNALTHGLISNIATATVRITADPTFDCPDLIGKVFNDVNANGVEDPGEKGLPGVRLVTAQGLLVTTDAEGRYHIVCPVLPDTAIGTNFILKLDERTLPSGYRVTTDNPDTVRLTAGKVSKLNFGATIHHVVRIELNGAAFDGNSPSTGTEQRIDTLVATLTEHPFILRIAYTAQSESDADVHARLAGIEAAVAADWKKHGVRFPLRTEDEVVRPMHPGGAEAKP